MKFFEFILILFFSKDIQAYCIDFEFNQGPCILIYHCYYLLLNSFTSKI